MKVTKKSAKLLQALVVFMAIALVATAIPAVMLSGLPEASAVEMAVSTATALQEALDNPNVTKITLGANIEFNDSSTYIDDSTYGLANTDRPKFTVPAGRTVELDMNNKTISWVIDKADSGRDLLPTSNWPNEGMLTHGGWHYVLIENKGNLTVTGNGTFKQSFTIDGVTPNAGSRGGATSTIVNSGNLTLADGVNVINKLYYGCQKGSNYTDVFISGNGVYQTGGSVRMGGNIDVDVTSRAQYKGGTSKHAAASYGMAYGIYAIGGSVEYLVSSTTAKHINVNTWTGFRGGVKNEPDKNMIQGTAMGIYTTSSYSKIIGANINTSIIYDDDTDGGSGGSGGVLNDNKAYVVNAVGVGYSTGCTPVIGSGTNISTSCSVANNDYDGPHPAKYPRAVNQFSNTPLNMMDPPGNSVDDYINWSVATCGAVTGTTDYKDEAGSTWTAGTENSSLSGGLPSSSVSTVHKVLVAYRYFDTQNNLQEVVIDSSEIAQKANAVTLQNVSESKVNLNNYTSFKYTGGGSPKNDYFYKLNSISYSQIANGNVRYSWINGNGGMVIASRDGDQIAVTNDTVNVSAGNTTLIYVDYSALPLDDIRVNINNSSMLDETNLVAEVDYKGSAPVFGQDIFLNVYKCMRQDDDPTAVRPYANDIDITNRFSVIANGTDQVTYEVYDADAVKVLTNSLPSTPGTYTVKMTLAGESVYNADPTAAMNFSPLTVDFTLIIRPRNVTITQTGIPEITYGQTLSALKTADLNEYFLIVSGVAGLTATGTFEWVTPNEMPEVGEHKYQLRWVNSQGLFETQVLDTVTVKVNKAPLTITAKNNSVVYGEALDLSSDDFIFAGLANKEGEKEAVFSQVRNSIRVDGVIYVPGGIDAGHHSYEIASSSTSNYLITNVAGELVIEQAPLTVTAPAVVKEYDGYQTVDIVFDSNCVIGGLHDVYGASGVMLNTYYGAPLANGGSVGQTTATIVPARVTLSGAKASNYRVGAVTNASTVPVNVVKASPLVDVLVIEDTSITYDPTKTLSGFANLVPANPDSGYIKVVAVGDTLADGRAATPGKWVWKTNEKPTVSKNAYIAEFRPDDSNYATVEQEITVSVSPRVITVGVALADVIYGSDQPSATYVFSGFPAGSAERISVSGSTYSAIGFTLSGNLFYSCSYDPNSSDNNSAGEYPVTISNTLTAENYRFVADPTCKLLVKSKDLVITPVQKSVTYGSTLQDSDFSFTAVGLVEGDEALQSTLQNYAAWSYSVGSSTPVGEYPLTVAFSTTILNYNLVINPGKIVVTKAIVTVTADDIDVTYGGTPSYTYSYSGFKGTDANFVDTLVTGAPTFSSNYSTSSSAGETFSIVVGVNGLSAENYAFQASSRVATLTVVAGEVNVTAWPVFGVENGKSLANATITTPGAAVAVSGGRTIAGTFRIDNRDAVLEYKNNGNANNTVAVTFYPTDTNYESVQGAAVVVVTPKTISGQPTIQGTLMVGETVYLDVSTLSPSSMTYYDPATIVWSVGGVQVATGVQSIGLTADSVGKTVTVSVSPYDDSGYTGVATYTTTIRISSALPVPGLEQLNIPQDTVTVTYDKQTHKFTVNKADQNIGDLTVRYNGSTTVPTAAGTYVVTVDIGTSNVGVWAPVSGLRIGTLVIEPRPIAVTFTAADKIYDGKTNAVISEFDASIGIIAGDNVTVNRSAATYSFVDANASDGVEVVMSYAYLEGSAKDNYVIAQETVYANILPKEITAVAYAAEQNYSETNYTVNRIYFGVPTGVLAADRNNIVLNNTTGSIGNNMAGSQDVTYIEYAGVLTGSKASNYTFTASNENTLKVNILQIADPSMEYPDAINVNYSSLQRLDDLSGELPYGWSWDEPMTVPTVRVKTYSATYKPSNASYKTATYKVVVNVSPVTVTVIPDSSSVVYGSPVPSLTYTVQGFTGNDSVADCSGMIIVQTNYVQGADVTTGVPYRVWVNLSTIANPNYTFNLKTEGSIEVTKRAYYCTPSASNVVYDPNNSSVTVNFEGSGVYVDPDRGADDVGLSYTATTGHLEDNTAGTRPVSYQAPVLVGSKANNYDLTMVGAAIAIQVLKADPVVVFPIAATVEYGQRFSTAVFDGGNGEGTFVFVDASKIASDLTSSYYDVKFTPTDVRNYNVVTQAVLLHVRTAEINISASINGTLYAGQTLTAAVSGVPQDALQYLHYAWYRVAEDGTEVLVSDASTYEVSTQDIGYYIRVEVSTDPTAPYTGTASFTTVRPIEEEQLTFWQKLMRWVNSILAAIQSIFDNLGKR